MSANMTEKRADTLRNLRDTLRYHKAIGIEEYPNNQSVQRFLEVQDHLGNYQEHRVGKGNEDNIPGQGIDSIEKEIKMCSLCQLSQNSIGRIAGKGKVGSRLMIVGDWSSQFKIFSGDTLFGQEEDVMLWKMMAAIGMQPEHVYVTNCLKCCPSDAGIINGKCEQSCFSFLAREIAAVKPGVICAMGDMAVRVLTGRQEPLSRLRSRFGNYRYQSGRIVKVMPTFHPRFLLQHQEMKKATWNDLLLIKKQLENF